MGFVDPFVGAASGAVIGGFVSKATDHTAQPIMDKVPHKVKVAIVVAILLFALWYYSSAGGRAKRKLKRA